MRRQGLVWLCLLLSLGGCSTGAENTETAQGSSITTVAPGIATGEVWDSPEGWSSPMEPPAVLEEEEIVFGTLEDYVAGLDVIFLGMDGLNQSISSTMSRYQGSPEVYEEQLKGFLREMETLLLSVRDLQPPSEFQYIQGEFAVAAKDLGDSYGKVAEHIGAELTPNTLLTLTKGVESQTEQFTQITTTLLQGLIEG